MKKAVIVTALVLTVLSSAAAETVLFCISDNQQQPEPTPWSATVLRAFEDGVMDVFFEAGHIVTNSFLNECRTIAGAGIESNSDVARIMANRMGADSVLILEIIFPEPVPDTLPVPVGAEYSLYTMTGKIVSEKSETAFDIAQERGEEELLDSFTEIGRNIASMLALKLQ